ncbi:hypothetical protein [Brachybacterium ginsengisoli]|uniref:hypothetical protein n=1 Tax=Brachybacterium ginsengisoli TaxID=1331682 RepID=UPI0014729BCD|nr:hypothetical protein [Brachybacterium ginsengisoli]
MNAVLVVIAFLAFAVLLAVGILLVVALPQLRTPPEEDGEETANRRHTSRTGR